ncbi:hypothetical protein ABTX82_32905 [Streptomyces lavendulae]|uniref:hypothetical protein n=1 Tax=Streptomyces lavendulae TaxID=1914 RepID=UPI00332617AD
MLDRFPQSALTAAAATQAVIVLGLYSAGPDPAAAVAFLLLMGGALKPVFITTPNAMLHCAPGRTKSRTGSQLRFIQRRHGGGRRARGTGSSTGRRAGRLERGG